MRDASHPPQHSSVQNPADQSGLASVLEFVASSASSDVAAVSVPQHRNLCLHRAPQRFPDKEGMLPDDQISCQKPSTSGHMNMQTKSPRRVRNNNRENTTVDGERAGLHFGRQKHPSFSQDCSVGDELPVRRVQNPGTYYICSRCVAVEACFCCRSQ